MTGVEHTAGSTGRRPGPRGRLASVCHAQASGTWAAMHPSLDPRPVLGHTSKRVQIRVNVLVSLLL